jgi:serine/threonine protein kinase
MSKDEDVLMDRETYELASLKFAQAVELSGFELQQFLARVTAENQAVGKQLERMLEADAAANQSGFFEPLPPLGETLDDNSLACKNTRQDVFVGTQIDEYLLEEKIGQGGMGVVYRAKDLHSQREIAIKLIRVGAFVPGEVVHRFRRERIAAAKMKHQNIVPIHASGQGEGFEYYTMALLEGGTLKDLLATGRQNQRLLAQYFLKLARAVEYAHHQGIIHRDIKPANILFTADREPMLTDFGIAKSLASEEVDTGTGQVMGTMVYMAPEQLENARDVGPAADIYGLGATFYECLAGQAVFEFQLLSKFCDTVKNQLPQAPVVVDNRVDTALSDICMKCLAKDVQDRYLSATDLAYDLECYLKGDPLSLDQKSYWNTLSKVLSFRKTHNVLLSGVATAWVLLTSMFLHPLIFLVVWSEQSVAALWATLVFWLASALVMSFRCHWRQYWQLTSMERQSGWILAGVNLAIVFLFLIHGPRSLDAPITDFLGIYPPLSLIVGVATFAHAGLHSGRWLLLGGMFFPLALLMNWAPAVSPLIFCAAGSAASLVVHHEVRITTAK